MTRREVDGYSWQHEGRGGIYLVTRGKGRNIPGNTKGRGNGEVIFLITRGEGDGYTWQQERKEREGISLALETVLGVHVLILFFMKKTCLC